MLWGLSRGRTLPAPRPSTDTSAPVASLADTDWFVLLDPAEAAEPWRNIEHFRNECSPYSGVDRPQMRSDGKLLIDAQYGRAFDFELTEFSAVYGSPRTWRESVRHRTLVTCVYRIGAFREFRSARAQRSRR